MTPTRGPALLPGAEPARTASLDVVLPIYNEAAVLPALFGRLSQVFSPSALEEKGIRRVRFLFIDDGSTDVSADLIRDWIRSGSTAVLYRFSRNFGHQAAVTAGLDLCDADVVAVIDADLQDPPDLILEMVELWRAGADVVYAVRQRRQAPILKRLGYWAFYRLISLLSEISVPLDSGDFCLLDKRVVAALRSLPERLRFPRGLRAWVGFRQVPISYERPRRTAGVTKYTARKLYDLATHGIASLTVRPLRIAQFFAFAFAVATFVLSSVAIALALVSNDRLIVYFLLLASLVSGAAFIQTICIYVLGAYVGRTYLEVKRRPPYLVMEVVDGTGDDTPTGEP
jgi:polyisoprenyl-phosphate glycosyltransferase